MGDEVPAVAKRRCVLVLNNAIWHKVKTLNWHHIEPLYLPPYSPDFNPIERLWQHPKSHFLAGLITKHNEELYREADHLDSGPHGDAGLATILSQNT
jgi:transposase